MSESPSDETRPVRAGEELDAAALDAFMRIAVGGEPDGPPLVRQFPGGYSNLTYAVTWDGRAKQPVIIFSDMGGIDIEEVAESHPEHLSRTNFSALRPFSDYIAKVAVASVGVTGNDLAPLTRIVAGLARTFLQYDLTLAEINPLVITKDKKLLCLDAKIGFDDNALFRHPDVAALRDETEEDPKEIEAQKYDLNYVALDGAIGCMVNGAGLAMATMDIIKLYGMEPANFLDVGGSVTAEGAVEAFRIILSDASVKAILVNIFGGIAKCDVIADALIKAAQQIGFKTPVVVRLEGTNVDLARKMLKDANIPQLIPATDLTDAAKRVCAAV